MKVTGDPGVPSGASALPGTLFSTLDIDEFKYCADGMIRVYTGGAEVSSSLLEPMEAPCK